MHGRLRRWQRGGLPRERQIGEVPLCLAASSGGRCGAQVRSQPGILCVKFTREERTLIFARLSKVESEFTRIALGFQ